ncbi:hypothetical protein NP233_g3456 [Leucocoprinus birnbaumii]|uniref:SET domain-containing protein n=1 Tax=Leucocoprinus birnbaumii TaxID=56174 RepID=A0AAD5YST5_9AGAR|nr:hypothetical protein NP233_g3456 [Leucocoprinus birnbaumii]
MSGIHPRWDALLEWLRQKGMNTDDILVEARTSEGTGYGLYALRQIPPSTPLFRVPAKAMMNIRTLVGLYPKARPKLTATQIMSLHLLLHRPCSPNDTSKDNVFGPYISVLPSNFEAHPLTWLIRPRDPRSEKDELDVGHDLLEHTPKGVLDALEDVATRFRQDWERICQYLRDNPVLLAEAKKRGRKLEPLASSAVEQEFLWGWLNVNTRCIYHRLCPTRPDPGNMTMCPILDFANHTDDLPHTSPEPTRAEIWNQAPSKAFGDDFVLLSPSNKTLQPGEEVFLKYGAHSNRKLFTEYGFINDLDLGSLESGNMECEADITWRMLRFFTKRGNIGTWMEELLKNTNYWGDWTIHSTPEPAPSFRLITALRLYHSVPPERILPPHEDHAIVRRWRDTIYGNCDIISPENESAWRETLDKVCIGIDTETGVYLDNLNKVGREWATDSWVHYMRRCLLMLWREQQHAACHNSSDCSSSNGRYHVRDGAGRRRHHKPEIPSTISFMGKFHHTNAIGQTLSCYLALFALAEIFELLMAFDALRLRNIIQLIGILAMMVFAALQVHQTRTALVQEDDIQSCLNNFSEALCGGSGSLWQRVQPFLVVAPCIIAASWLFMLFWIKQLYGEFGWAIFHVVGANPKMKTMYQYYQIMICLLKFDFFCFTGVTMQLLIIVLSKDKAEFGVTIAAIPVVLVLLSLCGVAVQREIKSATFVMYKLVRFYEPSSREQYLTTRATLTVFTIVAFVLLFATFAVGLRCFYDFDQGLQTSKTQSLSRPKMTAKASSNNMSEYQAGYQGAPLGPRISIE